MRRLLAVAMSLLFLGCARAPRSDPATAQSRAGESPRSDAAASQDPDGETARAESNAAPAPAEESPPEGAKKAKPAGDAEAEGLPSQGAAADDSSNLAEHQRLLDGSLDPAALSCTGAQPHVKAICSLAERICSSARSHPSTMAKRDCEGAHSSCEKAQRDYHARCE